MKRQVKILAAAVALLLGTSAAGGALAAANSHDAMT